MKKAITITQMRKMSAILIGSPRDEKYYPLRYHTNTLFRPSRGSLSLGERTRKYNHIYVCVFRVGSSRVLTVPRSGVIFAAQAERSLCSQHRQDIKAAVASGPWKPIGRRAGTRTPPQARHAVQQPHLGRLHLVGLVGHHSKSSFGRSQKR